MRAATDHPCFHREAHARCARMHLPVAPRCNISCGYCDRKFACVNESRPGVSATVLTPKEALRHVERALARVPELAVVGIAGPGDPLANPDESLTTLRLVRETFPQVLLCLSCNGLALPDYAGELAAMGIRHATVTVNAVDPAVGAAIYRNARINGKVFEGREGAELLMQRQEKGVRLLADLGVTVKINTVVIPGINDAHVSAIAERVRSWGAALMNCIPLIPVAGTPLGNLPAPSPTAMTHLRATAEIFLPQMRHCTRCRADALGLLGSSRTLADLHVPKQPSGKAACEASRSDKEHNIRKPASRQ